MSLDNPSRSPAPAPAVGERPHVLVVEDDEFVARMVLRTLATAGYAVDHATTGAAGLHLALQNSYEVVLLDLGLPEMDGLEVLNVLRRYDNQVPVVLISATPSFETAQAALESGANRYLTKPVEPENLLRDLESARLGRAQRRSSVPVRTTIAELSETLAGLELFVQPIMAGLGARAFAHEALMRSRRGATLLSPLEIVAACEAYRMTNALGRAVRARAAQTLERLPEDTLLFVNMHPLDLLDEEIASKENPLLPAARRTVLEITERVSLTAVPDYEQRILELRNLGFRFAIDDLGAGASGLARVAQVVPEFIKIDMSLVRGIHLDAVRARLVKALVHAARELEVSVIAEGIEQVEEFLALGELGCDYFQGYFFGRPGPV